eukprot:gene6019-4323_t
MAIFPGLCAEIPAAPFRLFLGGTKNVEAQLVRQLRPVHAWFSTRRRVREHANEFVELDLGACDAELVLRYCAIPFVRRFVHNELIDRQLTLIETGKAAPLPEPGLMSALEDCMTAIAPCLDGEIKQLQRVNTQLASSSPESKVAVESYDLLYLMRAVEVGMETDATRDAEMRARSFLSKTLVEESVEGLVKLFFGDRSKLQLDKRDQKLLQRQCPMESPRLGSVEKMRPADMTALFRFIGERAFRSATSGDATQTTSYFSQALMGNVFRKMATHASYLQGISMYWARHHGVQPDAPLSSMPPELAQLVCKQQCLFPALKLKAQYLYTSPDIARRKWRTDSTIPVMRLFSLLGKQAAEDLAAQLVVEALWHKMRIPLDTRPDQEFVLKELRERIRDAGVTFDQSPDSLHQLLLEGAQALCPAPTTDTTAPQSQTAINSAAPEEASAQA